VVEKLESTVDTNDTECDDVDDVIACGGECC